MIFKKASIVTKIVVVALLVYGIITIFSLVEKIGDVQAQKELLKTEAQELEIHNAELRYFVENSTDDDVIAAVARDELGLIKFDEKVFYDSEN